MAYQVEAVAAERPAGLTSTRAAEFGSDHVVDLLRALGYRYLPLNPGSSFRGLHDSIVNHGGNIAPQLLLCLHEEIAVSLAHGYAKATGAPAVAAVHDLVGLMHASMAVYDAYVDRVPLVVLGGSGPADPVRRRPIDWVHSATTQGELVRPFVKWDDEPATAAAMVTAVLRAHQVAASAPAGPAYVALDSASQEAPVGSVPFPDLGLHAPAPPIAPSDDAIEAAAGLLVDARLPVVVAGRVGRDPRSTPLLVELVELLGAAYQDEKNSVAFPTAHPHNCTGVATLLDAADVALAVDLADPSGTLRLSPEGDGQRRSAVIDLSCGDLALRSWSNVFAAPVPRDVQLLADPVVGLAALVAAVRDRAPSRHRDDVAAQVRARAETLHGRQRDQNAGMSAGSLLTPGRLVTDTWAAVRDLDWLLVLRNTRSWPEGVWQFTGAGEYLGHSGGGGVGYGPGAMVGGALAARDRGQLGVAIIGDGDLLMAAGALWTAAHYGIPMLVVVNDNRSFYNDEPHQVRVAGRRGRPADNAWIGTRIDEPAVDIAGLARSYGCWAAGPVTEPHDLAPALERAKRAALDGAVAVVHVHTTRG